MEEEEKAKTGCPSGRRRSRAKDNSLACYQATPPIIRPRVRSRQLQFFSRIKSFRSIIPRQSLTLNIIQFTFAQWIVNYSQTIHDVSESLTPLTSFAIVWAENATLRGDQRGRLSSRPRVSRSQRVFALPAGRSDSSPCATNLFIVSRARIYSYTTNDKGTRAYTLYWLLHY